MEIKAKDRMDKMKRREFLGLGGKAAVGIAASGLLPLGGVAASVAAEPKKDYYAFSRVFQFLDWDHAAELLAKAGYTGVEWTVHAKGHVEPARARTDLPKAIRAAEKQGLKADMIVVDFLTPDTPADVDVVKAAADCGVKAFRPAYFKYDTSLSVQDNLSQIRAGFVKLARLAEETGVKFHYQNHSTYNPKIALFGSLVWDLWEVIRDFDPRFVGVQYDPMHAMAESGPSWLRSIEIVAPWISTVCLKDFWFEPNPKNPKTWRRHLCPAGEGIVPWADVRTLCERYHVAAPYSVHYDYKFPSDAAGAAACAAKDVAFFKSVLGS